MGHSGLALGRDNLNPSYKTQVSYFYRIQRSFLELALPWQLEAIQSHRNSFQIVKQVLNLDLNQMHYVMLRRQLQVISAQLKQKF